MLPVSRWVKYFFFEITVSPGWAFAVTNKNSDRIRSGLVLLMATNYTACYKQKKCKV